MRERLVSARTVVVKVGSAVIAPSGRLETANVKMLADDIAAAMARPCEARSGRSRGRPGSRNEGRRFVIVSSGAVASGYRELGLERPPRLVRDKQAAAAVGQPRLMQAWSAAFESHGLNTAQVLLTAEDVEHRARFLNARHTLERLLEAHVVPIINENDSVSFEEIKLGDNDRLSSLVATLISAEALILLSSVPGVMSGSGGAAKVVPTIETLDQGLALVRRDRTETGVGGMETKIRSACNAASFGVAAVIASGMDAGTLVRIFDGDAIGTYFPITGEGTGKKTPGSSATNIAARKKWLGLSAKPKGSIAVDAGARRALVDRGSSLLPSGVTQVSGDFGAGDPVEIRTGDEAFARGLSSYPANDLRRIKGLKASQIAQVLGYHYSDEAVHRDDLVILQTKLRSED